MQFTEGKIYHIYNRGNNRQPIFFSRNNYVFFLQKVQKYISGCADVLSWTLMPNHFHFLIHANSNTVRFVKHTPIEINALTENIRLLLSSYTKAIQKQEGFVGNLFQQKTKVKCVNDDDSDYSFTAFHYIHQNAYKAGLVEKMEDWEFSSLPHYLGLKTECGDFPKSICNEKLASELLDLNLKTLLKDSYTAIQDFDLENIF